MIVDIISRDSKDFSVIAGDDEETASRSEHSTVVHHIVIEERVVGAKQSNASFQRGFNSQHTVICDAQPLIIAIRIQDVG